MGSKSIPLFLLRALALASLLMGTLTLAPGVSAQPGGQGSAGTPYIVQSSDTLGSIAIAHRVTVVSILAANPNITNPNILHGGERILIPPPNLRPGQSIWDGYPPSGSPTPGIPQTGGGRTPPSPNPVGTQPPPARSAPGGKLLPSGVPGSWRIIFDDEFDGTRLDTSKWITSFPWGSTSNTTPQLIYRPQNVVVSGGTLKLIARQENSQGFPYTSGIITTSGKFSHTYGFTEIRARVPSGNGLWPAFWSLPTNQAAFPEIDTIELMGNNPTTVHLDYHYGQGTVTGSDFSGPNFADGWHTYAVDWEPKAITWYVDGQQVHQFSDAAAISSVPMYLLANLQVGGWPGSPDSTTNFPATFEIDYIRVWQH